MGSRTFIRISSAIQAQASPSPTAAILFLFLNAWATPIPLSRSECTPTQIQKVYAAPVKLSGMLSKRRVNKQKTGQGSSPVRLTFWAMLRLLLRLMGNCNLAHFANQSEKLCEQNKKHPNR